jgi:ABC-2 type transport system permease protein
MVGFLVKSWAFFKRDLIENASYKTSFILELGGILANIFSFFFIAKLVGDSAGPYLAEYGGNYFPFVVIGIAFSGYLTASLDSYTQAIGKEQGLGTLEALLVTPTGLPTIALGGAIWSFIFTSLRVAVYLILGALFFGLDMEKANVPAALVTLLLTITSLSGFGIVSAGFTLMLKRGDPVNFFVGGFSKFLAGVYFPVAILPPFVQKISLLIPLTYSLRAMRMAILNGASFGALSSDLGMLTLFSLTLLPLSVFFFKYSVRRVMIDGSWAHY